MNERSFINLLTMARITDKNKIERLKQSTMKLVVEHGFGGASASLIAKDAKVASGYFYLHYNGKYEMVNSILQEVYKEVMGNFEGFIKAGHSFSEVLKEMVNHFVAYANKEPIKVKFLYVLINDYSFVIDSGIREKTYELIAFVREKGIKSGTLDPKITNDDLYLVLVTQSIQFINQRYKNAGNDVEITNADTEHLIYLITKLVS